MENFFYVSLPVHRGKPEVHAHTGGHAKASGGRARPADVSAPCSAGEGATAPLSGKHVESHSTHISFNKKSK